MSHQRLKKEKCEQQSRVRSVSIVTGQFSTRNQSMHTIMVTLACRKPAVTESNVHGYMTLSTRSEKLHPIHIHICGVEEVHCTQNSIKVCFYIECMLSSWNKDVNFHGLL